MECCHIGQTHGSAPMCKKDMVLFDETHLASLNSISGFEPK